VHVYEWRARFRTLHMLENKRQGVRYVRSAKYQEADEWRRSTTTLSHSFVGSPPMQFCGNSD
jgi:hypothetical protein